MFKRVAPIFAVQDLERALAFYASLGFAVRTYTGGGYGYACRDGVEIHLGEVGDADRRSATAYVFVDDAEVVAAEWRAAGAEVRSPQDTEWGRREGALIDPDGNVIRFGSLLRGVTAAADRE
jgi:catechol 2,3-dioxygenase-like lactoylglutathione lyase family enzyme